MEKAELAALLTAHGGRTQSVASLHVLRAPALSADDHAFLVENAPALATLDLSRWLDHASPEQRPAVIDALAWLAEHDPARFEFEIARAPHFSLEQAEREALAERLRGLVPDRLLHALAPSPAAPEPPPTLPGTPLPPPPGEGDDLFNPGDLLNDMDFGPGSVPGAGPASEGGLGDLIGELEAASGAAEVSRSPLLDALLAEEGATKSRRPRALWKARALALAKESDEDWAPSVMRLPPDMADAVSVRATVSHRAQERAALLEWLLKNGARSSTLVSLTLGAMALDDPAHDIRPWLAQIFLPKILSNRAGWVKYGARMIAALMEKGAYTEMDDLFTVAAGGSGGLVAGAAPAEQGSAPDLRGALFLALYEALASKLRQELTEGDPKKALACAAALASIGIPAQKSPAVRALRRKRSAKGDIATLLDLALKKGRGPRKVPTLEDFVAAVHTLASAMR